MRVVAVHAPHDPDLAAPERTRPILPVKFGSEVEAYATYDSGSYTFQAADEIVEAIATSRLAVVYQFDDHEVIAIRLIGDPQGKELEIARDADGNQIFTDQDPG